MDVGQSQQPKRGTRLKSYAIGCVSVAFGLSLVGLGTIWYLTRPDYDLALRPVGTAFTSTQFEFRFGVATRTVDDQWNRLRYVYGELPDSISVENGRRTIVYDSPKCIIKSTADSIDVQDDTVHHKGYMGIWSDDLHFTVASDGMVHLAAQDVEP
ncbi:hypothetical protein RE6C_03535 [Rhodopirellula europaea 6C]|uniref:Uncharacterized protein n=1 Tax=Rhodopirellula europaea 6C TaxID=1263867 RepID=M2B1S8_9BACT|nr:hypothetical protein RE6C_03535 [Rhodopirellula europaea 6C]